ncbi:MAG: low molecular weight protein-tyrosine-phosphatase [Bacteroidota bacterium]
MKILMVCFNDVCRSPLAKGILDHKLKENKLTAEVDTAGFEPHNIGEVPNPHAIQVAKENGIDISAHRARLFAKTDFDKFDKIFVMESMDYNNVKYMARNDDDMKKVDYLMNEVTPGKNKPVPNPYYGGRFQFNEVFSMISLACDQVIKKLK